MLPQPVKISAFVQSPSSARNAAAGTQTMAAPKTGSTSQYRHHRAPQNGARQPEPPEHEAAQRALHACNDERAVDDPADRIMHAMKDFGGFTLRQRYESA